VGVGALSHTLISPARNCAHATQGLPPGHCLKKALPSLSLAGHSVIPHGYLKKAWQATVYQWSEYPYTSAELS
jgi:hypothetical protein